MSDKLKVGVIGAGGIFKFAHAEALKNHPEVELAAICDIDKERAAAAAEKYQIPHIFTDYRELIASGVVEAIDICTPNLFHAEMAVAALDAGLHVFCEKPDAVDYQEALKMEKAAEASGTILMVMRNNRFRPASQFIKKWSDSGRMGDIYAGRCGWIRRRGIPGKGGWFTTKELSGGGPLIDLGVHYIDLALWFMGNPKPVSVVGSTYTQFADNDISGSVDSKFGQRVAAGIFDVEDLAMGFIRFENGASLQIEFSWASNIEEDTSFVELRGTESGFSYRNGDVSVYSEIEGTLVDIKPRLGMDTGGHAENLSHFIDVVQGRQEPIFTIDQGVQLVRIIAAIYESASTGREIQL